MLEELKRIHNRLDQFLAHTEATNVPVDQIEYARVIGEAKDRLGDVILEVDDAEKKIL
tara:strand:- start:659 stop:832 length:174 start_codon:yes stop_codon:yes gene_type:complete